MPDPEAKCRACGNVVRPKAPRCWVACDRGTHEYFAWQSIGRPEQAALHMMETWKALQQDPSGVRWWRWEDPRSAGALQV